MFKEEACLPAGRFEEEVCLPAGRFEEEVEEEACRQAGRFEVVKTIKQSQAFSNNLKQLPP